MIVAIDGPSGAGKSTVSKEVARRLGFSCLDTGAMYRAIAWQALESGVDLEDAEALGRIGRSFDIAFAPAGAPDGAPAPDADPLARRVLIGGVDVTSAIRTAAVDRAVSKVSAAASVRDALTDQQRRIGRSGDYVVEGRDIGTVVFPDAEVKVFLTASDAARAQRRVAQNAERGVGSTDFDEVLAAIIERDERDSQRAAAPLRAAADAVHIDSTENTIDEVVDAICSLARAKRA